MSYLRYCGLSLVITLICLTIGSSTNAQSRARSRVAAGRSHQMALPDENRLSHQRSQPVETSRTHPESLIDDQTGLKNLITYKSDNIGPGASYLRNKALPIPQPAAADTEYPIQQPRPRTYHRVPRYDNYSGDLVIPASRSIGFKLRIGPGTAYPY